MVRRQMVLRLIDARRISIRTQNIVVNSVGPGPGFTTTAKGAAQVVGGAPDTESQPRWEVRPRARYSKR